MTPSACKKRMLAFLLCLFLVFSVLISCTGMPETTGSTEISVTDALGREVRVRPRPTRVASLLGSFADVWTLAGGSLCAAAEDAWEDFGLSLPNAVNIGGAHSPSAELLLSSEPELVLASASTASHVALREMLESAGIPVLYFDMDNFEDYLWMLKICTDITGRADLYEKNGTALAAEIAAICASYRQADISQKERRVLLLRASSTSVKAKGSAGTILGEMLADLGCVNVADGENRLLDNLGTEAVIEADPYHILVVPMGKDAAAAGATMERLIAEDPAWGSLSAVKEGRVHIMDKALFHLKPNARFAEAYRTLYETLTEK